MWQLHQLPACVCRYFLWASQVKWSPSPSQMAASWLWEEVVRSQSSSIMRSCQLRPVRSKFCYSVLLFLYVFVNTKLWLFSFIILNWLLPKVTPLLATWCLKWSPLDASCLCVDILVTMVCVAFMLTDWWHFCCICHLCVDRLLTEVCLFYLDWMVTVVCLLNVVRLLYMSTRCWQTVDICICHLCVARLDREAVAAELDKLVDNMVTHFLEPEKNKLFARAPWISLNHATLSGHTLEVSYSVCLVHLWKISKLCKKLTGWLVLGIRHFIPCLYISV